MTAAPKLLTLKCTECEREFTAARFDAVTCSQRCRRRRSRRLQAATSMARAPRMCWAVSIPPMRGRLSINRALLAACSRRRRRVSIGQIAFILDIPNLQAFLQAEQGGVGNALR